MRALCRVTRVYSSESITRLEKQRSEIESYRGREIFGNCAIRVAIRAVRPIFIARNRETFS